MRHIYVFNQKGQILTQNDPKNVQNDKKIKLKKIEMSENFGIFWEKRSKISPKDAKYDKGQIIFTFLKNLTFGKKLREIFGENIS